MSTHRVVETFHEGDPFPFAQINGRPVLQPACNRVTTLERCSSLKNKKKSLPKSSPPPTPPSCPNLGTALTSFGGTISPKLKSCHKSMVTIKRDDDSNGFLISSIDKNAAMPRLMTSMAKKSKKCSGGGGAISCHSTLPFGGSNYHDPSVIVDPAPAGSIAVARRQQVNLMQAQRKMRIAHYGRTTPPTSKGEGVVVPINSSFSAAAAAETQEEKRCSFITPNSDPLYVAYHDEEWGVPVHEDRMLFELLVLTSAQVGLDWTSILKKRDEFRLAFAGFDVEVVANFSERQIISISTEYGLDVSRVRGAVDNANCIMEIRRVFRSFDKYLWGFVNHKPISTNYKSCRKIPAKTSKSEMISKDMVRRGFRFVGPTVMHSFMQAAGLTNDHLITCPRHHQCKAAGNRSH